MTGSDGGTIELEADSGMPRPPDPAGLVSAER